MKTLMKKKKTKSVSKKKPASKAKNNVKKTAAASFRVMPLADRVVVRPSVEEASLRPSGIYIPETADKERPQEGTVVAVGPGGYDDGILVPMSVKVGDKVMFSKYGYDEVKVDGKEYFLIKEENILAVIK